MKSDGIEVRKAEKGAVGLLRDRGDGRGGRVRRGLQGRVLMQASLLAQGVKYDMVQPAYLLLDRSGAVLQSLDRGFRELL